MFRRGLPPALRSISRKIITCLAVSSPVTKGYSVYRSIRFTTPNNEPLIEVLKENPQEDAHLEIRGHTCDVAHTPAPENPRSAKEVLTVKSPSLRMWSPQCKGTPTPSLVLTVPLVLPCCPLASSSLSELLEQCFCRKHHPAPPTGGISHTGASALQE